MRNFFKRIQEKFLSLAIRTRLLIFMLFLAIIPMIIVLNISMDTSIRVIEKNAEQANVSSLKMAAINIDALLTECVKQGRMISKDTMIRTYLKEPDSPVLEKEDGALNDRLMFLKDFTLNDISLTCVMGKNGLMIKSTYSFFKDSDFRDTDWYQKVIASDGPVWFDAHEDQFMVISRTKFKYVTMGMPVVDMTTGEKIGVVLVDIRDDIIYENILHATSGGGSQMLFYDADYNAILRTNQNALAGDIQKELIRYKIGSAPETAENGTEAAGSAAEEAFDASAISSVQSFRTSIAGKAYYVCVVDLVSGWKMVDVMSIDELTKDTKQIVPFSILVAIGVCVIAVFLSLQFSSSIARPIKSLIRLMKKVETGDFTGKFQVKHADEIGMLGNSYNIMLDEIERLMNTVLDEQRELLKAQFKILQEQINPHFLYNTLDSINWLSRMGRNDEVVVVVNAFTKLLRIALSKGRDVITVREEAEHVGYYLTIQQIRYKNKLNYEVDIPEDMGGYYTLKLILQPIVENAIYHGIKAKKGGGDIFVSGRELQDCLEFTVRDTGGGFDEDALSELCENLNKPFGVAWTGAGSFGIKNVSDRIKVFFGYQYGLRFVSVKGEGTTVVITIPKLRKWEQI